MSYIIIFISFPHFFIFDKIEGEEQTISGLNFNIILFNTRIFGHPSNLFYSQLRKYIFKISFRRQNATIIEISIFPNNKNLPFIELYFVIAQLH